MGPILDGYGVMAVFYSRTRPCVNCVYQLAGRSFSQLQTGRSRYLPARFTTERQPVLRPAEAFSKTIFKHR